MKKNVVKLNETQFRNILTKCIMESINEIGDTPEGRKALANAAEKAYKLQRNGQYDTFSKGLRQAVSDRYGEGATFSYFDYYSHKYKVRLFWNGGLTISNVDGSNKGSEDVENFIKNQWDGLKTKDRNTARRIAKWCEEYLDKSLPCYEKCLDWHTWALL